MTRTSKIVKSWSWQSLQYFTLEDPYSIFTTVVSSTSGSVSVLIRCDLTLCVSIVNGLLCVLDES